MRKIALLTIISPPIDYRKASGELSELYIPKLNG